MCDHWGQGNNASQCVNDFACGIQQCQPHFSATTIFGSLLVATLLSSNRHRPITAFVFLVVCLFVCLFPTLGDASLQEHLEFVCRLCKTGQECSCHIVVVLVLVVDLYCPCCRSCRRHSAGGGNNGTRDSTYMVFLSPLTKSTRSIRLRLDNLIGVCHPNTVDWSNVELW